MIDDWDWLGTVVKEAKARLIAVLLAAATIGAILLIAGCATWSHPFKDESAFHMDAYECEVQAAPVQDPVRAMMMRQRCMELKGWRQ